MLAKIRHVKENMVLLKSLPDLGENNVVISIQDSRYKIQEYYFQQKHKYIKTTSMLKNIDTNNSQYVTCIKVCASIFEFNPLRFFRISLTISNVGVTKATK